MPECGERTGRKSLAVFVLVFGAFVGGSPATGEILIDSTGQEVDRALDAEVSRARELRMENLGEEFDVDESIEILQRITEQNPNYYRAWYNLALSYLKRNPDDSKLYLDAFDRAAKIQESDPDIKDGSLYNSYGWALLNAQQYVDAEEKLKRGLALEETNTSWTNSALHYNLGRLYFERGDYDRSARFLDVAIKEFGNPAAIELRAVLDGLKK
jgi:tetratricopeptide (TPR) repeat protein